MIIGRGAQPVFHDHDHGPGQPAYGRHDHGMAADRRQLGIEVRFHQRFPALVRVERTPIGPARPETDESALQSERTDNEVQAKAECQTE
jgi:hypothetical protein